MPNPRKVVIFKATKRKKSGLDNSSGSKSASDAKSVKQHRQRQYRPVFDAFVEQLKMAFIMTVYNMKRAFKILGMEKLLAKLRTWKPDYRKAILFLQIRLILSRYADFHFSDLAKAA